MKNLFKKSYSPYCPHCNSCGETGCCPATMCTNHPKGRYCETNQDELKVSYYALREYWNQLEDDTKLAEIYNKLDDEYYEKRMSRPLKLTLIEKLRSFFARKRIKKQ